jgi:phage recombination protein Bet
METLATQQEKMDPKVLAKYLDLTGGANIPDKVRVPFLEIASAFNLNPFKREIYLVAYGNQHNIIVGYETYLKRAERHGQLDGWKCTTEGEGESLKAIVEVYRKDRKYPVIHEVLAKEFNSGQASWKKMPHFMLKKVAIAQAFRLAFPDDMSGLPYTEEETVQIQAQVIDTTAESVELRDDQANALTILDGKLRDNLIDRNKASVISKRIATGDKQMVEKAVAYLETYKKLEPSAETTNPETNEQA